MGGSNAPPNLFMNIGHVPQQPQKPINMGKYTYNIPYQKPSMGTSNVPPFIPSQGSRNYQTCWPYPGGTYASSSNPNPSNIPLSKSFNPSQSGGFAMPYGKQFQMEAMCSIMFPIPTRGFIYMQPTHIQEYPMAFLGMNFNPNPFTQST